MEAATYSDFLVLTSFPQSKTMAMDVSLDTE